MSVIYRRSFLVALASATLCLTAFSPLLAEDNSESPVVVYPIVFNRNTGTSGSRKTAVQAVQEVVQKGGYTLVSGTIAASKWKQLRIPEPSKDSPSTMEEIVRFGKAVHARYVIAPVFDFHSRSIWVDLGPKTISTATVDIVITDVEKEKVVYTKKGVEARSDEKFDKVKAVADILLTPLVTIVSGGPKTPHEQRAVQVAVARALNDWIKPDKDSR